MTDPAAQGSEQEEALLGRARQGDDTAFEELARRYLGLLYRMARQLTGDDGLASDTVQETLLRAYRGLPGYRGDCSFKNWLVRICINLCYKIGPRLSRQREELRETPNGLERGDEPSPQEIYLTTERREKVRRAVAHLPPLYRTVVVLHYFLDQTYQEIADDLGCPPGTVMSRLYKARRLLHKELVTYLKGDGPTDG